MEALSESLDISTVLDAAERYKQWLTQETSIQIDASTVRSVDAAGLQALTSLFTSANSQQINVQLIQPSQVLIDAINTMGLVDQVKWNCDFGEVKHD